MQNEFTAFEAALLRARKAILDSVGLDALLLSELVMYQYEDTNEKLKRMNHRNAKDYSNDDVFKCALRILSSESDIKKIEEGFKPETFLDLFEVVKRTLKAVLQSGVSTLNIKNQSEEMNGEENTRENFIVRADKDNLKFLSFIYDRGIHSQEGEDRFNALFAAIEIIRGLKMPPGAEISTNEPPKGSKGGNEVE